jgi:hypothetical protein
MRFKAKLLNGPTPFGKRPETEGLVHLALPVVHVILFAREFTGVLQAQAKVSRAVDDFQFGFQRITFLATEVPLKSQKPGIRR